jgi:hypothetical protein
LRPTAEQALEFDYITDAQVMCDYSDVESTPRRVDEKFFDFEREDYKLDELQKMVRDEVEKPCDDSVFFDASPTKKAKLHNNNTSVASSASASTHHSKQPSPSKKKYSMAKPNHRRSESDTNLTEADEGGSHRTNVSRNNGSESGVVRSKSAPPSPSPHKVEMISKQEKKQKRRFFLQGIQRIKQQTESSVSHHHHPQDSSRQEYTTARSNSSTTPSEQITSRVHQQQHAGVLMRGIQPVSARAKYLSNSMGNADSAPVSDGRAMEQSSGGGMKGSNVLSNFRDINFGSARQNLNSAPPGEKNERVTRLPSLKGSKRVDSSRK